MCCILIDDDTPASDDSGDSEPKANCYSRDSPTDDDVCSESITRYLVTTLDRVPENASADAARACIEDQSRDMPVGLPFFGTHDELGESAFVGHLHSSDIAVPGHELMDCFVRYRPWQCASYGLQAWLGRRPLGPPRSSEGHHDGQGPAY